MIVCQRWSASCVAEATYPSADTVQSNRWNFQMRSELNMGLALAHTHDFGGCGEGKGVEMGRQWGGGGRGVASLSDHHPFRACQRYRDKRGKQNWRGHR